MSSDRVIRSLFFLISSGIFCVHVVFCLNQMLLGCSFFFLKKRVRNILFFEDFLTFVCVSDIFLSADGLCAKKKKKEKEKTLWFRDQQRFALIPLNGCTRIAAGKQKVSRECTRSRVGAHSLLPLFTESPGSFSGYTSFLLVHKPPIRGSSFPLTLASADAWKFIVGQFQVGVHMFTTANMTVNGLLWPASSEPRNKHLPLTIVWKFYCRPTSSARANIYPSLGDGSANSLRSRVSEVTSVYSSISWQDGVMR